MKNIPYIIVAVLLSMAACKKSSTIAPSIVGTWVFSNITGSSITLQPSGFKDTTTFSYNPVTDSVILSENSNGFHLYTRNFILYKYIWAFNSDGTYIISEKYSNQYGDNWINNFTGKWEYLSTNETNNAIMLNDSTSQLIYYLNNDNYIGQYNFKVVNNTLVLTVNNSRSIDNSSSSFNLTITFTKQ